MSVYLEVRVESEEISDQNVAATIFWTTYYFISGQHYSKVKTKQENPYPLKHTRKRISDSIAVSGQYFRNKDAFIKDQLGTVSKTVEETYG